MCVQHGHSGDPLPGKHPQRLQAGHGIQSYKCSLKKTFGNVGIALFGGWAYLPCPVLYPITELRMQTVFIGNQIRLFPWIPRHIPDLYSFIYRYCPKYLSILSWFFLSAGPPGAN